MNKGKYVFSQLLDFLDRNDFNYLARKYDRDKYVKQFTCYNQLATLMFGQLSNRESLRDVAHKQFFQDNPEEFPDKSDWRNAIPVHARVQKKEETGTFLYPV